MNNTPTVKDAPRPQAARMTDQEKRAAALRENLLKRKAQTRARTSSSKEKQ